MVTGMDDDFQVRIRLAAFSHVRSLAQSGQGVTYEQLSEGFVFEGERVHLLTKAAGIFKPRQMDHLLSIRTGVPKPGRRIWYSDQLEAHQQIYAGDQTVSYAFTGRDPGHHNNQQLKKAYEQQIPVIYFVGIAPGRYDPHVVYIGDWNPEQLEVQVVFSEWKRFDIGMDWGLPEWGNERRYAIRQAKHRLHQTTFRAMVLSAYGYRCAVSGLPESQLIDAAHIVADSDEMLGQPVVNNGLPLSKIHHSAFDQNLIGIDPDCRIHVSQRLLSQRDGDTLTALQAVHMKPLLLPRRPEDRPDPVRLEQRFAKYKSAN